MSIARCQSAGEYRVQFEELGWVDGGVKAVGHMKLELFQHAWNLEDRDGSPIISTEEPFEGELCAHELAFLRGFPGKHFTYKWRFTVTPLPNGKNGKKGHI